MTPTGTAPDNLLLAALGPDVPGRLGPHLEPVDLGPGAVLLEPGATVWQVWFPEGGVVALGGVVREGTAAGLAVGREGAVGLVEALDGRRALGRATVLVPGRAWRVPVGPLRVAAKAGPAVGRLCQGYAEVLLLDALRSASCTPHHPTETRLARWLLHLRDRAGGGVRGEVQHPGALW
jgi:CRP-like cAMP-binding protein